MVYIDINICFEFVKIFGKKDFVVKIYLFEENVENFFFWKVFFKNVVREISFLLSEEMDLLI